ncbi:MAG: class I SAM-dependent methyltransferase [Mucilaginibacter sp.]
MYLKENSPLDRYNWTAQKIEEICSRYSETAEINLFDVGARDNILKKYITSTAVNYRAFDLEPLDASAEEWNIEQPFPYKHTAPEIVTMLEIVEHLNNPWLCLKNIAQTMKPGGYLILTTPNPAWSSSRLELLKSGYLSCFRKSDLDLNHHIFTPWPHIINKLLTDSGFEIIEYSTIDGQTKLFDKNLMGLALPFRLISRAVKKIIELRDRTSCGMSYGIIAKRKN